MFLLRGYEQWHGNYFVGGNFSAVARGRKFYVIVLVCLGSAFLVLCFRVLVCVRQLLFLVLCRKCVYFCEGTDALSEVTDLYADIPQEGAACLSSHYHDCFWIQFGQI